MGFSQEKMDKQFKDMGVKQSDVIGKVGPHLAVAHTATAGSLLLRLG